VEFSTTLDLEVNSVVQRLALVILKRKVPWIRDVVPALGGVALHFDPDNAEFPAQPLEAALEIAALAELEYAPVFELPLEPLIDDSVELDVVVIASCRFA